jgi:hypothetical protein
LAIVYFHEVALLNWFGQVPVIISNKSATCFIVENQHELVHVDDFTFNVDVSHPVPYFIYSHPRSLQETCGLDSWAGIGVVGQAFRCLLSSFFSGLPSRRQYQ